MTLLPNGDVVVVLPGILGSVLSRGRHQTWGYRQLVFSVGRLTGRLTDDLALPAAAFTDPAAGWDDGTQATSLMETQSIIPGLWAIDGYDKLLKMLRERFAEDGEAIYEFPYDWRLSNEFSAFRLKSFVEPILQRRRAVAPDAKVVFVAHSMGGLVARFYAECLDQRALTRRVVTVGTPYQGAVKALTVLANGSVHLGPVTAQLGELVRSLPAMAELLPVFPCFGLSPDTLVSPEYAGSIPGLPAHALDRCLSFYGKIAAAVGDSGRPHPFYHALLSHQQPTELWAALDQYGAVRGREAADFEDNGDGTVPRRSASPPEWADDATGHFMSGRHATLHCQKEALLQVFGILTARPRRAQAAFQAISAEVPPFASPGDDVTVRARSVDGTSSLALVVSIVDTETAHCGEDAAKPVPLWPRGDGLYKATVTFRRPGLYRWTIESAMATAEPIDPVTDFLLCGDD